MLMKSLLIKGVDIGLSSFTREHKSCLRRQLRSSRNSSVFFTRNEAIRYCVFEIACHLAADKGRLFTSIGFFDLLFCDIALVINLVSLRLSVYYIHTQPACGRL